MKSIGTEFLGPDALPGANHTRGMQYQIVLNITFWSEYPIYTVYKHTSLFIRLIVL